MYKQAKIKRLAMLIALTLSACSGNDNNTASNTSELNPNTPATGNTGEPGGDTTSIAGLWDATTAENDTTDVFYWDLAANGVLTGYDYQQDSGAVASGENCYIVGDPITVTPEGGNAYSIDDVATTILRNGDSLSVVFNEADKHDLNANGNITELPTFTWTALTTPVLEDLNSCTSSNENPTMGEDPTAAALPGTDGAGIPDENVANRPLMTRAQCTTSGGRVVGDIGNGAIHRPEYLCESGIAPIARITYLEGESIASEGEVCCL